MLVLKCRTGQTIHIGSNISVTVTGITGKDAHIGIDAPKNLSIKRDNMRNKVPEPKTKPSDIHKEFLSTVLTHVEQRLGPIPVSCQNFIGSILDREYSDTCRVLTEVLVACLGERSYRPLIDTVAFKHHHREFNAGFIRRNAEKIHAPRAESDDHARSRCDVDAGAAGV